MVIFLSQTMNTFEKTKKQEKKRKEKRANNCMQRVKKFLS